MEYFSLITDFSMLLGNAIYLQSEFAHWISGSAHCTITFDFYVIAFYKTQKEK